jgi:hypothetical protein
MYVLTVMPDPVMYEPTAKAPDVTALTVKTFEVTEPVTTAFIAEPAVTVLVTPLPINTLPAPNAVHVPNPRDVPGFVLDVLE